MGEVGRWGGGEGQRRNPNLTVSFLNRDRLPVTGEGTGESSDGVCQSSTERNNKFKGKGVWQIYLKLNVYATDHSMGFSRLEHSERAHAEVAYGDVGGDQPEWSS